MTDFTSPRPPLDRARLAALAPQWRVEVEEEVTSTNALVAERARAGERAGFVVVAEHQSAGRGRLDRAWQTPPRSSLMFSVLLRPSVPVASWPMLPLLTGYAVVAAVADRVPDVALKWPNDVLVPDADGWGRKLAGILVERIETPDGPAAVIGCGINVSQATSELPQGGTSLALEVAAEIRAEGGDEREVVIIDRADLLAQVLGSLDMLSGLLDDPEQLIAAYRTACSTLGREVDVHLPGGRVHRGTALDLDSSGALVVSDGDTTMVVNAGDVVHVRPAG